MQAYICTRICLRTCMCMWVRCSKLIFFFFPNLCFAGDSSSDSSGNESGCVSATKHTHKHKQKHQHAPTTIKHAAASGAASLSRARALSPSKNDSDDEVPLLSIPKHWPKNHLQFPCFATTVYRWCRNCTSIEVWEQECHLQSLQWICTGLVAPRGQRLGEHQGAPHDGQDTEKTLRTIIWYKRACIRQTTRQPSLAVPTS